MAIPSSVFGIIMQLVKFIIALAMATAVQACSHCQCQDSNGNHCCAAKMVARFDGDCDKLCAEKGITMDGVSCNANGASNCISGNTYPYRAFCKVSQARIY